MKLYNSYTQSLEDFQPLEEGKVSMYVCGPTVYNYPHIGNARPIVVFDTLVKTLEADGYDVTYASNYTDVDDKIINKAIEENTTEREITDRYIAAYKKVRADLNAKNPDVTPRVTETMDGIISFIQKLVDKGSAYQAGDDVYFRVCADKRYCELSHQCMDDLQVGARIDENTNKDNPLDFTLWKKTDKGIQWDSPWGKGRPGWHTECVVMINDVFKKPLIDIHGGGIDLKFPHHENEMAQSRCSNGTRLANTWVHNGMINIDDVKMSKSLGNVIWAQDLIDQYSGPVVRLMMVSTHYRAPLNLSQEALSQAQKELTKIEKAMQQAYLQLALNEKSMEGVEAEPELWNAFLDAMNDDLNTPNAITVLQAAIKKLNQSLRQREKDYDAIASLTKAVEQMCQVLGIALQAKTPDAADLELYRNWKAAVAAKDFDQADGLRKQLMEKNLV